MSADKRPAPPTATHDAAEVGRVFAPTPWFRLPARIEKSRIEGAGLGAFSLAKARRGELIAFDLPSSDWLVGLEELQQLPDGVKAFCWRHLEHVYFRGGEGSATPAHYLNHSTTPNLLWHIGCYFADDEIQPGDELTVDYRHLAPPGWQPFDVDGRPFEGFEWRRALLESSRRLVELMEHSLEHDS